MNRKPVSASAGLLAPLLVSLCVLPAIAQDAARPSQPTAGHATYILPRYLGLSWAPALAVPVGTDSSDYGLGFGGNLSCSYMLPACEALFVSARLGYDRASLVTKDGLSLGSASLGLGAGFWLSPRFRLAASAEAGGYYGFLEDKGLRSGGGSVLLGADAQASLSLGQRVSLCLDVAYRYDWDLYSAVSASIGLTHHIPVGPDVPVRASRGLAVVPYFMSVENASESSASMAVEDIRTEPVFPVFLAQYLEHPLGQATIVNTGKAPLKNVRISLYAKQVMESPTACAVVEVLEPGASKTVDLLALFTDGILAFTEDSKIAGELRFEYEALGKSRSGSQGLILSVYDRNAMRWTDDRAAAAFVTAKDPSVLLFAKNAAAMIRDRSNKAVGADLAAAIAVHECLSAYGIEYVRDPKTPYGSRPSGSEAVDFLQFPRQTLEYGGGDCDDLSILNCALLEALSVETALITVPGHIYMAVAPAEASSVIPASDMIASGGRKWIPIEITMVKDGFMKAWREGLREWRESEASGAARLYPLHDAWRDYPPAGLPGSGGLKAMPDGKRVLAAWEREAKAFADAAIAPRLQKLKAEAAKSPSDPKARNRLGILYASFGRYDEARAEFAKAAASGYVPAMVNQGNVALVAGDQRGARTAYEKAVAADPRNAGALASLARLNYGMEDYSTARDLYAKLAAIDPAMAAKHSYLGDKATDATRASAAIGAQETCIWME